MIQTPGEIHSGYFGHPGRQRSGVFCPGIVFMTLHCVSIIYRMLTGKINYLTVNLVEEINILLYFILDSNGRKGKLPSSALLTKPQLILCPLVE